MVPRGEVGLILAGIGLAEGILDDRYYGVLVAVVLLSTLIAPPWMRWRASRSRKRVARSRSISLEPQGGWLHRTAEEVELAAEPPEILAPQIGLEASIECAKARPGPRLLQWLSSVRLDQVDWNPELRDGFFALLRDGNERSWRFLEVTGLNSALLPALERALQERRRNPFELDPAGALRWAILADLNASITQGSDPALRVWERLEAKDVVRLAALARDAFDGQKNPAKLARRLAESVGLSDEEQELVAFLVAERHLLPAASARLPIRTEESVIELAVHLATRERADALYVLAVAENAMHIWERERLDELFNLVQEALGHADLVSPAAESLIRRREAETIEALWYLPGMVVRRRLETLPRRYLFAQSPEIIARHLKMTKTIPERLEVRLEAEPVSPLGNWLVHVAALDRKGLLASVAGALASHEVSVVEAFVSTWRNGVAVDVFRVEAPGAVDWDEVRASIGGRIASENGAPPIPIEGVVRIDNLASPWHTIVEVQAEDRRGLLYRVASALSRAGLQVHMATVSTVDETAVDIFYVTGRNGAKLDLRGERDLRLAFSGKRAVKWRLPWRLESETTT
jgi:UTP:GlnB (protein PII) uridylyltransferase